MLPIYDKFEEYLLGRRDVLFRFAKKYSNNQQLVDNSIYAVAGMLTDEGDTLTLVSRKIGQTLDPDAADKAQCKLGGRFINFLHVNDWIDMSQLNDDTWMVFVVDSEFADYIEARARTKRVANITEKPLDWHKPFNRGVPIVKRLRSDDAHHYTIDSMPQVYKALNVLQSTEWEINSRILDLMVEGLDGFSPTVVTEEEAAIARSELTMEKRKSLRYEAWKFDKLFKKYNRQMSRKWAKVEAEDRFKTKSKDAREVAAEFAKMIDFIRSVELAAEVEYEPLYFQHNCDSRGRLYSLSNYLSPQGADHQKALLRFATTGSVSDYWIKVHIANCAGQDKLSFSDRIQWVEDNREAILAVGNDPRGQLDWLIETGINGETKTRWQFIAACMEFVRYTDENIWRIPVGIDATSSGLQFLAAIARDELLAEHVNISTCSYAPVGDVYQMIGNALVQVVDSEKSPATAKFKIGSKPLRKLCKRSAMTFPYSCQGGSMGKHLYEDRGIYGDDDLNSMSFTECSYLGQLQYEVIKGQLPRAAAVMSAMQDSFNGYRGNPTVSWTAPTGFRVTQYKPKIKRERVQLDFDKRSSIKIVLYTALDQPSLPDHRMAISPNVIHCLDASMMVKTICAVTDMGVTHFHAVHDQLGGYAGEVDMIGAQARVAFHELIKNDPIEPIMIEATGKYEAPEKGSWNPSNVLTSSYFLC